MANYRQGEFCWYELGTRDLDTAVKFYTELLQWGILTHDMGEYGLYYVFQIDGRDIGAAYKMSGPQFENVPPNWMPYIWVDDVDATASKTITLGGRIIAPPLDVPIVGRMAFLQDPQGANFAIFKGNEHQGAARLAPKPGTFSWTELMTTNPDQAKQFYSQVLGWKYIDVPTKTDVTYTLFRVGDKHAAGMFPTESSRNIPPNWTSFISVAHCDRVATRAVELGAKVMVAPQDVPGTGRFAVLQDPTEAVFAIISFEPM
jgi:predicted enzyme related to lactoylglutathione lyase